MAALPKPVATGSLPAEKAGKLPRQADSLWLALQILDPEPDSAALESLADSALALTSVVLLRPGEGLLLEVRGSLRYFSGLATIRQRLAAELEQRGWRYRLATAPTPLAAAWLVRHLSIDVPEPGELRSALGRLPLTATGWPDRIQLMLRQMGLKSIADCLRLPRAGFARRIGRERLDDLDRALGRKPDPRTAWRAPQRLCRSLEFTTETTDRAVFAEALDRIVVWLERELRRQQLQIRELELRFRHLRAAPTLTRIRFVDPVHAHRRILEPLLARLEQLEIAEPAIALSLATGLPVPLKAEAPGLSFASALPGAASAVPEFALVECLRGRFGAHRVHGIGAVAEHRPELAWRPWIDRPLAGSAPHPPHERPLWLLPGPRKKGGRKKGGQSPFSESQEQLFGNPKMGSDPLFSERIESGWWDGRDVRRDYYVVIGAGGEKLWFYRDCASHEWYLHGIFG